MLIKKFLTPLFNYTVNGTGIICSVRHFMLKILTIFRTELVLYEKTRNLVFEETVSSGEEIFVQVFTCMLRKKWPSRKKILSRKKVDVLERFS